MRLAEKSCWRLEAGGRTFYVWSFGKKCRWPGCFSVHSAFNPFFVRAAYLRFAPARQLSARKDTGLA